MSAPHRFELSGSIEFARRYRNSLRRIALAQGSELDDVIQELHIHYAGWLRDHDATKASLQTFIHRRLIDLARQQRRREGREGLNVRLVSFDVEAVAEQVARERAAAALSDDDEASPDRLPAGLPELVRNALATMQGCGTIREAAIRAGVCDAAIRKRLRLAIEFAGQREAVLQADLFSGDPLFDPDLLPGGC